MMKAQICLLPLLALLIGAQVKDFSPVGFYNSKQSIKQRLFSIDVVWNIQ